MAARLVTQNVDYNEAKFLAEKKPKIRYIRRYIWGPSEKIYFNSGKAKTSTGELYDFELDEATDWQVLEHRSKQLTKERTNG